MIEEHAFYTPDCDKYCNGCQWCHGGLQVCKTCGAFEGATPDDCPGKPMSEWESDNVYHGNLNYRAGEWREECCQVMRPVYDLDNLMAEQGYYQDGLNNAGNPKWVKRSQI